MKNDDKVLDLYVQQQKDAVKDEYRAKQASLRKEELIAVATITTTLQEPHSPASHEIPTAWVALVMAPILCIGEAIFLSPVMDMLGVFNRLHQLLLSFIVVFTLAAVAHVVLNIRPRNNNFTVLSVLGFTCGLSILLGVAAFIGKVRYSYFLIGIRESNSELMSQIQPNIVGIVIVAITILLPFAVAICWEYGTHIITAGADNKNYNNHKRAVAEAKAELVRIRAELATLAEEQTKQLKEISSRYSSKVRIKQ